MKEVIREFISKNELGAVIGLSETNERYYPKDSLASTVLYMSII